MLLPLRAFLDWCVKPVVKLFFGLLPVGMDIYKVLDYIYIQYEYDSSTTIVYRLTVHICMSCEKRLMQVNFAPVALMRFSALKANTSRYPTLSSFNPLTISTVNRADDENDDARQSSACPAPSRFSVFPVWRRER